VSWRLGVSKLAATMWVSRSPFLRTSTSVGGCSCHAPTLNSPPWVFFPVSLKCRESTGSIISVSASMPLTAVTVRSP